MVDNQFEIYKNTIARRNKIRWLSVIVYLILVLGFSAIPFILELDESEYELQYTLIILSGSVILILLLIFPYFNKITPPKRPDGHIIKSQIQLEDDSVFALDMKLRVVYYIVVPMTIFEIGLIAYLLIEKDLLLAVIFGISFTLILLVLVIFDTISVLADKDQILIRLGPLKDVIPMVMVDTIRSISIRPFKDFMGIGKRLGPDGSIGYIAYKKTGVRIETKDGKLIVVTMDNPQEFTEFVRYFKPMK